MTKLNLSLEEYIEEVKQYTYNENHLKIKSDNQQIEVFYIPFAISKNIEVCIPDHCLYQVSGNNTDGFIVTLWRQ